MLITLWYPSSPALVSLDIGLDLTAEDVAAFASGYGAFVNVQDLAVKYPDFGATGFVVSGFQDSAQLDETNSLIGPGAFELLLPTDYHLAVLPPTSRGFFTGFCASNIWFARRGMAPLKTWDNVSDALGSGPSGAL